MIVVSTLRERKQQYEAMVTEYEAKAAEFLKKALELERTIATLLEEQSDQPTLIQNATSSGPDAIFASDDGSVSVEVKHSTASASAMSDSALRTICYGKSIADAAIAVLATVGHSMREDEILPLLQRGGVTFVSGTPLTSLRFALMRKQKDTHTVKEFAPKLWGLSSWPEASSANPTGFVSHRSKSGHMEASLKGLWAARERGVKLGRAPKITEEHLPRIKELLGKSVRHADIAEELGVTRGGLIKAINRFREQGLLPPANKARVLIELLEAAEPDHDENQA